MSSPSMSLSETISEKFKNPYDWWWDYLRQGLESNPKATAFICPHQASTHLQELIHPLPVESYDCLSWTYEQLDLASDRVAGALYARGIRGGVSISTFIPVSAEWALMVWASAKLRTVFVPQDPLILQRPDDLVDLFKLIPIEMVLVDNADDCSRLNVISTARQKPMVSLVKESSKGQTPDGFFDILGLVKGTSNLDESIQKFKNPGPHYGLFENYRAVILFTSGTTNRPKGCEHTVQTVVAGCESVFGDREVAKGDRKMSKDDRVLVATAAFRSIAFAFSVGAWRIGASVVYAPPPFDPVSWLNVVRQRKITFAALLPAMYYAVANHPRFEELRPGHLSYLIASGDVVTAKLCDQMRDTFNATVVNYIGMTEGWGVLTPVSNEDAPPINGFMSVGKVLSGHARVCDQGSHKPIPRGSIGELHVSTPSVISSYLQYQDTRDLTSAFYDDDKGRWFITGDQALMNENGAIYILGRYKDVIKRSGVSLSPVILEDCLNSMPGVSSQVIGVPDKAAGEAPVAIIAAAPGFKISKEDVKSKALSGLGPDYSLVDVFMLAELGLEKFPLNSNSKVLKTELRAAVERHHGPWEAPFWKE